ncbi:MAG TPA: hypothetical protein VN807_06495, partial [Candidatus Sulfotelmatobacter sp.]|nr:hypothetical protein [Candidatus Sulfotelmatobacter sp.]
EPYDGDLDDYTRLVLSAAGGGANAKRDKNAGNTGTRRGSAATRDKLKPLKAAVEQAEREVAGLQARIANIDTALAAPGAFGKNAAKGAALAKDRTEAMRELTAAEHRWVEAAEALETASRQT